uniref:Uncharcaterized protein n=1 Tax=Clytia hemisphaerica TaxID=252671 RepID=A0A069DN36_9CNID
MFLVFIRWCLLVVLLLGNASSQGVDQGTHSMIRCYGDDVIIQCANGEEIQITDATYQVLDETTSLCRHVNRTTTKCYGRPLREQISSMCAGKGVCKLEKVSDLIQSNDCKPSLYLKVSYNCIPRIQYNPGSNIITTTSRPRDTMNVKGGSPSIAVTEERKISSYLQLVYLFMQIRAFPDFIQKNPRKSVLCLILSLAFGIFLMILYMLIFACCNRCRRRSNKKLTDSAHEVAGIDEFGWCESLGYFLANWGNYTSNEKRTSTRAIRDSSSDATKWSSMKRNNN